ncbi:MAG: gliding motility-associated C-terminal domain-containing protein, partial [Bacteroidetes bacterium]|nr:gliding motility-associated C-terminal domain-containing protein [Bacteroidota bacterium]
FTPNGDGYNDCFHPAMDIQNVPNITTPDSLQAALAECIIMEVWDRWGIKMFETTDADKCWDGKNMKGKNAVEGTYYYIAKFGEVTLRGFVTLLRK